ncbi:tRNA preQ1(34) S-adenosylmethionine ribosyltransferase-isomerase QueA [Limnobacter parvus]|uniref:S-adenosylmethionine:tRNA ribosyltransferase-isomerase n=1 Tax=Limnobacter parvus TaxID=2939690 RepID=A0ABT1XEV8_9BURK|nr:tRNA preQ1(34) S-adenosylmethionine ribosyltransferase-isomerase QueA [Limnobacter parvus]MCR2745808.1 tRNA preQ1(34) S-adenosylmethionine ribosyltransferase-isomerase QueA [Limnobacter parvus]
MKLSDFDFVLPEHLIAQHPPTNRGESRLLACAQGRSLEDQHFKHVLNLLQPNDVLVVNDTKVLKARLQGQKVSGGKIEVMLERILDDKRFTAMIRASKSPKPATDVILAGVATARVLAKHDMMYELELLESSLNLPDLLETHGALPLPPYIEHDANAQDDERYQTVFAREPGAVAAPTAGLHFTDELLQQVKAQGVNVLHLTLHVGAGTFLPVKTDNVEEHVMHSERYSISGALVQALLQAKQTGGRIVAVGTTSLRALEAWATETGCDFNSAEGLENASTFAKLGHAGDTQIFIKPGYSFKVVDCLITNFHLPKSTLLMLVSAFAGKSTIFSAYEHAIAQQYRFFSYGDAMWLERAGITGV